MMTEIIDNSISDVGDCDFVEMGFVGNCPVHCIFIGGIETSCRDNFTKYWPSLLKGYSFACHDHICTCGVLTKPIRKRHKLGRVKCRYHATRPPLMGETLEEDDGFENTKNMRRIGFRRKKKDKKRKEEDFDAILKSFQPRVSRSYRRRMRRKKWKMKPHGGDLTPILPKPSGDNEHAVAEILLTLKEPVIKKRGPYTCNRCGQPTKGHNCVFKKKLCVREGVTPLPGKIDPPPQRPQYKCTRCGVLKKGHVCTYIETLDMEPHSANCNNEMSVKDMFILLSESFSLYKDRSFANIMRVGLDLCMQYMSTEKIQAVREFIETKFQGYETMTVDDVVRQMKDITSRWSAFKESKLFPLFGEMASLCCILFLTPKEFIPALLSKKDSFYKFLDSSRSRANNVLDWFLQTFTAIVVSLQKFVKTRSVLEAFCAKTPFQEATNRFEHAMDIYNRYNLGLAGNLDYTVEFNTVIEDLERIANTLMTVDNRRVLSYVTRVKTWKAELNIRESGKGSRVQPFAFTCTGSTGTGKTGLAYVLIPYLLKVNGYEHSDRNMINPNMSAKHWDGVSNDTYGMHIDDPDFMKPQYVTDNTYVEKIGRVLNNAQYIYEMASLENKGTTVCNAKVVGLSSNDSEYGVQLLAKEPPAIHRRFNVHADIRVDPKFCKVTGGVLTTIMDSEKVFKEFGDDHFPDVYIITAYEATVVPREESKPRKTSFSDEIIQHQVDRYAFTICTMDGVKMENIRIRTFLELLKNRSKQWFEYQERLVTRRRDMELKLCRCCELPSEDDICCSCYDDAIFGSEPDCDGEDVGVNDISDVVLTAADINKQVVEENAILSKDYVMGKIPLKSTKPGKLPCVVCSQGFAPECLWGFVDTNSDVRGICRLCLATTRVYCRGCQKLSDSEAGMKKPAKLYIRTTQYCKCCHRAQYNGLMPHAGSLQDSVENTILSSLSNHEHWVMETSRVEKNVRQVLREFADKGVLSGESLLGICDNHITRACADFTAEVLSELYYLLESNGFFNWMAWMPRQWEDQNSKMSFIGKYVHGSSMLAKRLNMADQYCTIALGTISYFGFRFNPFVGGLCTTASWHLLHHTNMSPVSALVFSRPDYVARIVRWYLWANSHRKRKRAKIAAKKAGTLCAVGTAFALAGRPLLGVTVCGLSAYYAFARRANTLGTGISNIAVSMKEPNDQSLYGTLRDNWVPNVVVATMVGKFFSALGEVSMGIRHNYGIQPHGGTMSIQDFSSLDSMSKFWYKKAWHDVNLDPLPVRTKRTPSETINKISRNILVFKNCSTNQWCNAVALRSKLVLVPGHMLSDEYTRYEFRRKNDASGLCGNALTVIKFRKKDCRKVAPDLYCVENPTLGDFMDISTGFADAHERIPQVGSIVRRDRNGDLQISSVSQMVNMSNISNRAHDDGVLQRWDGLGFHADGTFGWCMGMIISYENPCAILGFYLGGNAVGNSVGTLHTRHDVEAFSKSFDESSSYVMTPCSGTFPQQMYNRNCIIQGVHPNSIAAQMPQGNYKLFGSTGSIEKDNHDIVDTPIAPRVYETMCTDKKWGPPPLKGEYSERGRKEKWLYTLSEYCQPKEFVPRDLLDEAVDDYLNGLSEYIKEHPPSLTRELTDDEVVQGIDGCDFIGPMEPSTSVGFPLGGSKRKYMESYFDGTCTRNRFTDDKFKIESEKLALAHKQDRRCYPVSKAFIKIEPTPVDKEKCRIVFGAPLHLQFRVRKLFAAAIKYICEHPDFFECSVGVCPYGDDWKRMHTRLKRNAKRCIALDYKMYDGTTSGQVIQAAFAVLISISRSFGFSEDQLAEMRGLAGEIINPVVCANGDVFQFNDGTVSGHNLTSVVNSIVNSLNLRMVYYSVYKHGCIGWFFKKTYSFRDVITAYFYGDDLIATVSSIASKMNNYSVAEILTNFGRRITTYDKKPIRRRYDKLSDVEYLKRRFVYHRETKQVVGVLREDSIFKRLVCVHKPTSPNTMYTLLADNIDSACTEWFFYGKKHYNMRRKQLANIVNAHDDPLIRSSCDRALRLTYNDRLKAWESLYL